MVGKLGGPLDAGIPRLTLKAPPLTPIPKIVSRMNLSITDTAFSACETTEQFAHWEPAFGW
jgi:hypothetical protein